MPSSTLLLLLSSPSTNPAKTLITNSQFTKPTPKHVAIGVEAKLRKSKVSDLDAKRRKKIVFFDESASRAINGEKRRISGSDLFFFIKKLQKRVLPTLANLPLAISEMFTIATLMALATFIDQGETPDFYFHKFPEQNPLFGFVTWRWVIGLGFDHMFTSPIFLGMLVLLAASLMSCTYTTQIPMVKVARRSLWLKLLENTVVDGFSSTLPRPFINKSFQPPFHLHPFRMWVLFSWVLNMRPSIVCFQGDGWSVCSDRSAFSYVADYVRNNA